MILIVNLNYDLSENDQGHLVYDVPYDAIDAAKDAVEKAHTLWATASANDTKCIDEYIDEELRESGIPFESLEYDVVSLDTSGY